MNTNTPTSKTRDIYLAAALLTLGYVLQSVDKRDSKHQEFIFEISPTTLKSIELEYANERLVVNLAHLKNALQRMKSIIHNL